MDHKPIFSFKADISRITIPKKLNNPFGSSHPEIALLAASEFQELLSAQEVAWEKELQKVKGKMFGVLVVEKENGNLNYLAAVSGKLPHDAKSVQLIPTVFDDSIDDYFINRSMTELTEIGNKIRATNSPIEVARLTEERKLKSVGLQQKLFANYQFMNISGTKKNVLEIFDQSDHGNPPAAAGECAAPKLLHYAIKHKLKPIALAEFWWGSSPKNNERKHKAYYPACKNKCRPILEFMLEDFELFNTRNES